VDRRLKKNQTGKRRVVVAMREREGRTLPFIALGEGEGVKLAIENVSRTATMSADEASHWDTLHDGWMVDRVNHSEIYSDHGKHTNMVESFFSRLRNMIEGQHHGVSPKYLHQYASHAAWLEDNRRTDNGTLAPSYSSSVMLLAPPRLSDCPVFSGLILLSDFHYCINLRATNLTVGENLNARNAL